LTSSHFTSRILAFRILSFIIIIIIFIVFIAIFIVIITAIVIVSSYDSVAAKAMRNELNRMANNIQDPEAKRIFGAEMEDFFLLFNRYLTEKAKGEKMYVL